MAKIIKLTQEYIEQIKADFAHALGDLKLSDGKLTFSKSFDNVKRDATLYFTELAWLKMQTLIREFDKEVGWHGIAKRGDDPEKDEYIISDILVYPQEVTGATVTTDQEKYQMWLMSHEDEVFNSIRMQGHSHVNMSTSPSSVDTSLYERILEQLDDDMFYIFLIYNKKGEKTIKIYDLAKNVLFETSDVTVKILDDGTGIEKFLSDAKDKVKEKTYTYASSGYWSYGTSGSQDNKPKQEEKPQQSSKKDKKRKGKRKAQTTVTAYQTSLNNAYESDEDWDDPYGSFGWDSRRGF